MTDYFIGRIPNFLVAQSVPVVFCFNNPRGSPLEHTMATGLSFLLTKVFSNVWGDCVTTRSCVSSGNGFDSRWINRQSAACR